MNKFLNFLQVDFLIHFCDLMNWPVFMFLKFPCSNLLSYFTATCDQASYNSPVNPDWMGSGWYRFVDTAGKTTTFWSVG